MFASADHSYKESKFVIIGVPFDKTSSFRAGSLSGPRAVRSASYCFEPYLMEHDVSLSDIAIHDSGDLERYDDVEKMGSDLRKRISDIVADDKIPIVIGGEHSLSPFAVSGFEKRYDKIDVMVFDAHLDYRDEYEGLKNSHATAVKRISEIGTVRDLKVLGVRSISEEESSVEKPNYFEVSELDEGENDFSLTDDTPLYLSIDMDVFDPSYAPGVGNPEPFGVKPGTVKKILQRVSSKVVGLDIVETNPKYDVSEITSNLAARLIYEFICSKKVSIKKK
ncbi:MAG: agmatinase [Candidatus Saliniplasma sp.]